MGLRNQRAYAVRSGFNALLDVARLTYKEATDDVHELFKGYNDTHQISMQLKYASASGFFLALKTDLYDELDPVPEEFLNPFKRGKFMHFTTLTLVYLY